MERRNLCAGLMVLASSLLLFVGSASASTGTCNVKSLPSFTAQGEFGTTATVADVIEVGCDPAEYGTGSEVEVVASQLYSECNGDITWYIPNPYNTVSGTRGVKLKVDADGNATVALIAGPQCSAGESLVAVHELNQPFESVTTSYSILPPNTTPEGVTALPATQIEDAESSAVATIIEAEFPGKAEAYYRVGSAELFSRCQVDPHLRLIGENGSTVNYNTDTWSYDPEATRQQLDNDGNGFVLAIGDSSCYPGSSLIEADLEAKPFKTLTTSFAVEAPAPRFF
jgi:hypothetical protein